MAFDVSVSSHVTSLGCKPCHAPAAELTAQKQQEAVDAAAQAQVHKSCPMSCAY